MELFGIYRRTCDDNNKVDLKKMTEVEWIKLAKNGDKCGWMFKARRETSGSKKQRKFLDWLRTCQLIRKSCNSCS